jgi:hypothetical protein
MSDERLVFQTRFGDMELVSTAEPELELLRAWWQRHTNDDC